LKARGWGFSSGLLSLPMCAQVVALLKAAGASASKDRLSLCQLFSAWGGAQWLNREGWGSSLPLSAWHGVTCDPVTGRVASLYLGANGLAGPMQAGDTGLEKLSKLKKLSLFGNHLSGPVCPAVAKLIDLNYLDLEENQGMCGHVPKGVRLECKDKPELQAALEGLGLGEVYAAAVREAKRQAKAAEEKAAKAQAAAAKQAAIEESLKTMAADNKEHGGKKGGLADAARRKEAAAEALAKEAPALAAFADLTSRCSPGPKGWADSSGWCRSSQASSQVHDAAGGEPRGVDDAWFGVELDKAGRVGGLRLGANRLRGDFAAAGARYVRRCTPPLPEPRLCFSRLFLFPRVALLRRLYSLDSGYFRTLVAWWCWISEQTSFTAISLPKLDCSGRWWSATWVSML